MLDATSQHQQKNSKNTDGAGHIAELQLFSGTMTQLLDQIRSQVAGSVKTAKTTSNLLTIATPNPEMVVQATVEPTFAQLLQQFSLRIPDGVGLVHAAKLLSVYPRPVQRIPGVEVVAGLLALEELHTGSVLVVGGRGYAGERIAGWVVRDAAEDTERQLGNEESSAEKTLWWHYGFLESTDQTAEEQRLLRRAIEDLKPRVVCVALGAPAQEQWVIHNRDWLEKAGVRVAMVVGGAFDMLLGKIPRAPRPVQKIGLEWAYRLYQEPWRWRRQLRLIRFVYIVGAEWLRKKFRT